VLDSRIYPSDTTNCGGGAPTGLSVPRARRLSYAQAPGIPVPGHIFALGQG